MTKIMIHQPHFLPWLPYIYRVAATDIFVALDDVKYRKGYFHNRSLIFDGEGGHRWLTMPVECTHGPLLMHTRPAGRTRQKQCARILRNSYERFQQERKFIDTIANVLIEEGIGLVEMNIRLLKATFLHLDLALPEIYLASSLNLPSNRTERLIEAVRRFSASHMLVGWGAMKDVHDVDRIIGSGLTIVEQSKEKSLNGLGEEAAHGLSFVDLLCRNGVSAVTVDVSEKLKTAF